MLCLRGFGRCSGGSGLGRSGGICIGGGRRGGIGFLCFLGRGLLLLHALHHLDVFLTGLEAAVDEVVTQIILAHDGIG